MYKHTNIPFLERGNEGGPQPPESKQPRFVIVDLYIRAHTHMLLIR